MGWYRRFCCFSTRNKKPIQGWLLRSSFSTNNISYSLNHCFSSRNKKPIQGWLSRSSFNDISYSLNPRPMFSYSSQPTYWKLARFQSIHPFLNGAGAKRFYCVDRYQEVSHFRRLCTAFSVISGVVISAYCFLLIVLKLNYSKTVPYTKRSRIVMCSWHAEKKTGREIFGWVEAKFREKILPLDHPDSIRIQGIAHNIVDALHRDLKAENHETKRCDSWHLWDLEFIVFDGGVEPCRNFGNKIVVSRGLLDYLTSDAEIATVIGHEVAHVVGRHNAEKITKMILWCFPNFVDDSYLPDMLSFFERLPFSRRLELEADYIGMMLMASAGYDPRVAPQVYEKLREINHNINSTSLELISMDETRVQLLCDTLGEISHNNNSTLSELFSTHPHAKRRVQLLTRAKVMKKALCRYREAQRRQSKSEEAD